MFLVPFRSNQHRYFIHTLVLPIITLAITLGVLGFAPLHVAQAQSNFPHYQEIQENVDFWNDVYSKYSSQQGILHDRTNLAIVYDVVDLVNWEFPGSSQLNKKLIQLNKKLIETILTDLSQGKKPTTKDEKRIAALFPHKRHTAYLKAKENIRLQIGQKDHFQKGVVRSGRYMEMIKKVFDSYGLPKELAYLAHVESSFNAAAHSKASARGLWQFTRTTGQQYLNINDQVDERLDPYLSTQAAAKMLKENHAQLNTWPLAITAYNYGRSGMHRAVNEQKSYPAIFQNYDKGYFKFASRNFYSEFLAALDVAQQLEKSALILEPPEQTMTKRLDGYALFSQIQTYFAVPKEELIRLNPALLEPVLRGAQYIPKGYLLRLPASPSIQQKIKNMGSSMYYSRQIAPQLHLVRKGETISHIAKKHRTSSKVIMQLNQLDNLATIRVGQKLKLPYSKEDVAVLKNTAKKVP